jgi:hypothetical protein
MTTIAENTGLVTFINVFTVEQSMLSNPVASPYVEQALAIATFEPRMYEVVKVVAGPSKPGAD